MSDSVTREAEGDTNKVEHDADRERVTWADATGGSLHTKTVSSRLRYGADRMRTAHVRKNKMVRWPSPRCEPRPSDKLRRGLCERDDDDWHLDNHVMCDDLLPTET